MTEHDQKNWRELCNDAIAATDMDELLSIIEQLNAELEREEKIAANRIQRSARGRGNETWRVDEH